MAKVYITKYALSTGIEKASLKKQIEKLEKLNFKKEE